MKIKTVYRQYKYYLEKHGVKHLLVLAIMKFWQKYVDTREVVFLYDLDKMDDRNDIRNFNLSVRYYNSISEIPNKDIEQLINLKCEDVIVPYLNSFSCRGVTLALASIDETVVALQWHLIGGFDGFYSLPMTRRDVIFLSAEVFPEYRGRSICPEMIRVITSTLRKENVSRIYLKVHVSNTSSLRTVVKPGGVQRLGVVRTYSIFGRYITIWDKKSMLKDK